MKYFLCKEKIKSETHLWERVERGKIVKIIKKGRGKCSDAVGTLGVVKSFYYNSWGTAKVVLIDKLGNKHWTTVKNIAIVSPVADDSWKTILEKSNDYIPFIGTIVAKARSGKSSLVRFTAGKEMWIPHSVCPDAVGLKLKSTSTIKIPKWLAEKNELVKT